MTSRTRIEAMQRTIERIRRERRAGVGIIAPDSDGGVVLTCTAYGRQGETRQQARFDSIDEAREPLMTALCVYIPPRKPLRL